MIRLLLFALVSLSAGLTAVIILDLIFFPLFSQDTVDSASFLLPFILAAALVGWMVQPIATPENPEEGLDNGW